MCGAESHLNRQESKSQPWRKSRNNEFPPTEQMRVDQSAETTLLVCFASSNSFPHEMNSQTHIPTQTDFLAGKSGQGKLNEKEKQHKVPQNEFESGRIRETTNHRQSQNQGPERLTRHNISVGVLPMPGVSASKHHTCPIWSGAPGDLWCGRDFGRG